MARLDYNKQISIKIFNRFQNKIKNCSKPQYEWRPSDVCTRERNCFRLKLTNETNLKTTNRKKFPQASCPCPRTRPFICGRQRSHCSRNKEACESFNFTYKNINSAGRSQLLDVKKCVTLFDWIFFFFF